MQRPAALRVFESFDRDGNGHVSRRVFRRALEDLGFDLLGDEDTGAEVLDHFDPDRRDALFIPSRTYRESRRNKLIFCR